MKTDYKKAIKKLIKAGKAERLFYYKPDTTTCYFVSDGCCIITMLPEDFELIPTYTNVKLIENNNIMRCIEDIQSRDKLEATKTSLMLENTDYNGTKQFRVFKLNDGTLVPVNNAYVEAIENTIYQGNIQYCNGLNTKTPINYIDTNIYGTIAGGFAILPVYMDVKGKLEYLLGLQ